MARSEAAADESARPTHPSLKDAAAEFIRQGIVSGTFGPGAKVDQDEIAGILGISRLPVREALIELAQKGFVAAIPRRGAFVVELSVEDVEDHFEVVGMVFALAARRAAEEMDASQLEQLRSLHRECEAAPDPDTNREFVRTINRAGSSRMLRSILQFLGGALPGSYYPASPAWAATEAKYRKRILAALEARDADAAAATAIEHLRECGRLTIEVLRERGYWDELAG